MSARIASDKVAAAAGERAASWRQPRAIAVSSSARSFRRRHQLHHVELGFEMRAAASPAASGWGRCARRSRRRRASRPGHIAAPGARRRAPACRGTPGASRRRGRSARPWRCEPVSLAKPWRSRSGRIAAGEGRDRRRSRACPAILAPSLITRQRYMPLGIGAAAERRVGVEQRAFARRSRRHGRHCARGAERVGERRPPVAQPLAVIAGRDLRASRGSIAGSCPSAARSAAARRATSGNGERGRSQDASRAQPRPPSSRRPC